jgi:polygalacturonase
LKLNFLLFKIPLIFFITTITAGLPQTLLGNTGSVSIEIKSPPYNAVGDGIHDDSEALQRALDTLAEQKGGRLVLPTGIYLIKSIRTRAMGSALGIDFKRPNTSPLQITGQDATIKFTDPKYIGLNISGVPIGSEPWMTPYLLNGVEVTGVKFIGTRVPNDSDIEETQANTLLYFTDCENVKVTNCSFENCVGCGVYYFVRDAMFDNNRFINANGGIQGNSSQEVTILGNLFNANFKCDDQIGIFSTKDDYHSKDITIKNNNINKGWNGSADSAGAKRGWAHDIIVEGACENVSIEENSLLNSGSSFPADFNADDSMYAMFFLGRPEEEMDNVKIINNKITNNIGGIYINGVISNFIILNNVFKDIRDSAIRFGRNAPNDFVLSEQDYSKNVFENCLVIQSRVDNFSF